MGSITLPVLMGIDPYLTTIMTEFLVVRMQSAYNAIIGRPSKDEVSHKRGNWRGMLRAGAFPRVLHVEIEVRRERHESSRVMGARR